MNNVPPYSRFSQMKHRSVSLVYNYFHGNDVTCYILYFPQFRSLRLRRAMPYTVSNYPQSVFIWLVSRKFYLDRLYQKLLLYRKDSCKNALSKTLTLISPCQQLHIIHLVMICNYFPLEQTLLITHELEWLSGFCIGWTFIIKKILTYRQK